ncbi:MAG TPA: hypothetical protein VND87_03495 [Stellaceae bacterium]|nr:hypothetical protein [Stellaceae bacterium]
MPVMYEVNGYDRETGTLKACYEVPWRQASSVGKVAGIAESDDGLGSYPLDEKQVAEIAVILECCIAQEGLGFFLEPYDAPQQATG